MHEYPKTRWLFQHSLTSRNQRNHLLVNASLFVSYGYVHPTNSNEQVFKPQLRCRSPPAQLQHPQGHNCLLEVARGNRGRAAPRSSVSAQLGRNQVCARNAAKHQGEHLELACLIMGFYSKRYRLPSLRDYPAYTPSPGNPWLYRPLYKGLQKEKQLSGGQTPQSDIQVTPPVV